jgi:monoamine oxidase
MLYSHAGIVAEMYDHTIFEEDKYGFMGFLNGGAASYTQEVRKEFVLWQLGELLGEKATKPTAYIDKVGTDEFVLAGSQTVQRPHQHNGHPLLQSTYMHDKLFFCGIETATAFPGYMEGAVTAARSVSQRFNAIVKISYRQQTIRLYYCYIDAVVH